MRKPHYDIIHRDDNLFDVVIGNVVVAGPFENRTFAMRIASGEKPASIRTVSGGNFAGSGSCAR
jgi:hypothetical protein